MFGEKTIQEDQADDVQRYTGNNHVSGVMGGHPFHMSVGNDPVLLVYRDQKWLMEWHYYFGPSRLHRKTHDQLKNQPGEHHPFWRVAQWWKDQGCRVVDGVGQWTEPPIVERRYQKVGRNLIADEAGTVVLRFWQGYEKWGAIRGKS